MMSEPSAIVIEETTDPIEQAEADAQRGQFDRNAAWLQEHASEVYAKHRGKCICVAGQELFIADTPRKALAQATKAHPHDKGRFVIYVPKDKLPRIYAH